LKFVLPIQNLVKTAAKGAGFPPERLAAFKTAICEDNVGALMLAKLEPGGCTPRSEHCAADQDTLVQILSEAKSH
jgi:hypothetical protein